MKTVIVFGTYDSKGKELQFLLDTLERHNVAAFRVDLSMKSGPWTRTDITAEAVAAQAGYADLKKMREENEREKCLSIMAKGAAIIIRQLVDEGKADGVISIGGGQGSIMAGIVMRELPVGLPKVIVSTMATVAFAQRSFVGVNDTFIINPLVDVAGLNPVLCSVLQKAAVTLAAMVNDDCALEFEKDKKRVGITMWGVTTPCVDRVRETLERAGVEAYVFHANYMGGRTFERLVEQGFFNAVADLTLPEITQSLSTGENGDIVALRLTAAGKLGIPQVVSVGGVDMVNCPLANIPEDRKDRKRYYHTPVSLFVRSTKEENLRFAEVIAEKLNAAKGAVTLLLPLRGTSAVNAPGGPLFEPETDAVLFEALKRNLHSNIQVEEFDANINDAAFADRVSALIMKQI